ncbi:radical SAM protein [Streptomyces spectabilis]|uniref:MoaA/NifB/PqqE/SkfB family radical SAM enzyme n=1 Tax=Streptomyces spectabilis TaxID=68270 RepID=A0A7W8AR00_STRST|nr:radical SAM protein [Streptomyces spectabilis]MBB5103039.1 MoaA/NifB/PqqE/SkfB family radical SAM enzyme [Streptomyces spectabilis]MCI3902234.1 radical SAM protein [Streptomyces spectabilis]
MKIPKAKYDELSQAVYDGCPVPRWLSDNALKVWGIDLARCPAEDTVVVRPLTRLNYSRATWEINKGCNFNCEHCYLADRRFAGLPREEKGKLIQLLCDAGVLWLQITGGEPTIDRDFTYSYRKGYESGMLIEILTNGSRLCQPRLVDLLTAMPPQKVTVSLYGATPESFDSLTRKPGSFRLLMKGLEAARGAGLPLELALIITKHNVHERKAMQSIAEEFGTGYSECTNISPTYDGNPEPLAAQAPGFLDKTAIFEGCSAGKAFFHVDPHGLATMCKVGRENPIDLMGEGLKGLVRLPAVADAQMLRVGGCSGCVFSDQCRVCRPVARARQLAKAPLESYCQHGWRVTASTDRGRQHDRCTNRDHPAPGDTEGAGRCRPCGRHRGPSRGQRARLQRRQPVSLSVNPARVSWRSHVAEPARAVCVRV